MMDQKLKALLEAGSTHDPQISGAKVRNALAPSDRTEAMRRLRVLGFTFEEIGQYYGVSRARVEQIIPGVGQSTPRGRVVAGSYEMIRADIWTEAYENSDWWTDSGKMSKSMIVDKFRANNYTWEQARKFAPQVSVPKIQIVLFNKFGIDPLDEVAGYNWLVEMAGTMEKGEVFQLLNDNNLIQIPFNTFSTFWRKAHQAERQSLEAA